MPEKGPKPFPLNELTAISTVDGRYRPRTVDLAEEVSEYSLIKTRMEVESMYLIALSDAGIVRPLTNRERTRLTNLGPNLSMKQAQRVKTIENETRHDVKAMERTMRELFGGTSLEDITEMVHLALTSEDVNNLSYRLMITRGRDRVVVPAIERVVDKVTNMAEDYIDIPMLGRTHGQGAIPTTVGKEIANFATRLHRQTEKLKKQQLTGKLNGAIGNFSAHDFSMPDIDWIEFSKDFVKGLGFEPNLITTQINPYEDMIELFQNVKRINGVILDMDQDFWRYISDDWIVQDVVTGEIGSSILAQKVNPIDYENSEGNTQIANSLLDGLSTILATSRLQRDLSDSTVVRNSGFAMALSLVSYKSTLEGLRRVRPNEQQISESLNGNWSILTEGVQTLLRREGYEDPYTMVSKLSRGIKIGPEDWAEWVGQLDVSDELKKKFGEMRPEDYLGYAKRLTRMGLTEIRTTRTGKIIEGEARDVTQRYISPGPKLNP